VQLIFEHWKTLMHYPEAQLDPKRRATIQRALAFGYSVQQLCQAIRGCSLTPHNQGQNDKGQRFDGLQLILGSADQIDRFRHNEQHPPRLRSPQDPQQAHNLRALEDWMSSHSGERSHGIS
jgi:hypothetical protein